MSPPPPLCVQPPRGRMAPATNARTIEVGSVPRRLRYAMVIEWADGNWSAYVPDVPGCVTVGDTPEEVERNMREALALYVDGEPVEQVPEPTTGVGYVEVELDLDAAVFNVGS